MQHQGTLNYSEGQSGKPPYLHQDKLTAYLAPGALRPLFLQTTLHLLWTFHLNWTHWASREIALQTQPWAQLIDGDIT